MIIHIPGQNCNDFWSYIERMDKFCIEHILLSYHFTSLIISRILIEKTSDDKCDFTTQSAITIIYDALLLEVSRLLFKSF